MNEKDTQIAICKACNASAKSFSTSGLIYHLKSKHPDCQSEYEKNAAAKREVTPSPPTPSVANNFEKAQKFPSDSIKAQRALHKKSWNSLP